MGRLVSPSGNAGGACPDSNVIPPAFFCLRPATNSPRDDPLAVRALSGAAARDERRVAKQQRPLPPAVRTISRSQTGAHARNVRI
jgi:hypothetical protein